MRKRTFLRVTGTAVLTGAAALAVSEPAGADSGRGGAGGGGGANELMKVELGRRLFFDPALGRRGRVGCAECHQPEKGFSDERAQSADEDRLLPRHSQPTVDLGGEGFHWDGEFPTVRDLIDARTLPAAEALAHAEGRQAERLKSATARGATASETNARVRMSPGGYGGGDPSEVQASLARATPVAARLAEDGRYDEGFRLAFGDASITPKRVGDALEAYVASIKSGENALDRHLAGRADAMTEQQQRGLALFGGKANCSQCHALDVKDGRAALTDGKFHDTGVGFGAMNERMINVGGRASKIRSRARFDFGRGGVTLMPEEDSSFKTPSLRDVARRAPYMHNASLATLDDVVAYYDKGGTPNPHLDSRIKPLALTADERSDLVAFLGALTGDERPGLGAAPGYRQRALTVTIQDLEGRAMPKLTLRVVPCGDRLSGTDAMPAPFDVTTGDDGTVSIALPLSTHVRLESVLHEIGLSRPIPDWTASATLFATPRNVVSVRVRRASAESELPPTIFARIAAVRARQDGGKTAVNAVGGDSLTLTRALRLSSDEAVYTMAPMSGVGTIVAQLTTGGDRTELGIFEIDVSGGASETIDLRAAEDVHPEFRFDK